MYGRPHQYVHQPLLRNVCTGVQASKEFSSMQLLMHLRNLAISDFSNISSIGWTCIRVCFELIISIILNLIRFSKCVVCGGDTVMVINQIVL